MQLNVHGLTVKGNLYLFRMTIPKDIRNALGRSEIKRILPTHGLNESSALCSLLHEKFKGLFKQFRQKMLTGEEILRMADDYLSILEVGSESYRSSPGERSPEEVEFEKGVILARIKTCQENLKFNRLREIKSDVDFYISWNKVDVQKGSPQYQLMCREFLKKHLFWLKKEQKLVDGDYGDMMTATPVNMPGRTTEWKPEKIYSLKELSEKYFTQKGNENAWDARTTRGQIGTFKLFLEIAGENTAVSKITHHDLLEFRDNILLHLPANITKFKKSQGKDYKELLKIKGVPLISKDTVNDKISMLSSFFKWASKHNFTPKNIGEDLEIKLKKNPREERSVYEKDDIIKLLTSLPRGTAEAYKFWISAIALFSGMRQGEICQLFKNDIVKVQDVWCFNVSTLSEGQKTKNESSRRLVPIHPVLMELGFFEYLKTIKGNRLWPKLELKRGTYAQDFQKWYGRFNRKYITKDKKKPEQVYT